ncbi:DUF4198 domain-containing protein [Colwellia sp. Arc7-635]|uniref:DUF4198 domain-containing protein n=1 Tax=Colwellia sp. Arc7-635 TaxID=2497879 RepID=UPI000F850649|nr:DUF4198 domain-containing protein [Colwellia sp. Arc7-635]AZQ84277.1 DUF4198 domain-containing protein [Colwellia sp. Arc7-635]
MKKIILASALFATCTAVQAHDIWIKADTHEINSEEQKVFALDVSRSAQAYVAESNHEVKSLMMTSPKGTSTTLNADYSGKVKEVFEVEFNESGTYHFESPMTQVFLSFYFDEAGKKHKIRMPKTEYHTLPKGSKPEKTVEKQIITETYVSYNGFSDIKQTRDDGLQIVLMQHPNKLRAGKAFSFKLTYNGQPIPEAEVALKSLNEFYYQDSDKVEVNLTAKDKGLVTFKPKHPGRYLMGVEFGVELKGNAKADFRSIEKFLTFEITQ